MLADKLHPFTTTGCPLPKNARPKFHRHDRAALCPLHSRLKGRVEEALDCLEAVEFKCAGFGKLVAMGS